jgi:threonine/homoserine/homoserine lactone efflux protein
MPQGTTLLLFVTAALSINLTPGPDMLYVIARSIGQGRGAGVISALGLMVGYVVYTLLAATGLAALFDAVPVAYGVVRVLGAAYLTVLGVRTLRARSVDHPPDQAVDSALAVGPPEGWAGIFRQGALTSTLNPSIAVFFLAFLPQFIDPARPAAIQIIVLGLVFTTTATLTHTVIALLTGTAGRWLRGRSGGGWVRYLSGGVLILLGVRVLFQV